MKAMKNHNKLLLSIGIAALLSACGSTAKLQAVNETPQPPPPHPVCCINPDWEDPEKIALAQAMLSEHSIYFDDDGFIVKDDYRPIIEAHARFLVTHRHSHILIVGNTDERGGHEYNLALGQKRAGSVTAMLLQLGVRGGQIDAISHGKETPRVNASNEAAWAENRRVDVSYL